MDADIFKQLLTAFGSAGVAGLALFYHLRELAPELRAIWRSIDRLAAALLLQRISAPNVSPVVKEEATAILTQITEEEERGKVRDKRWTQSRKDNKGRG